MRRRWTSSPRTKTRWRSGSIWIPPASSTALAVGPVVAAWPDPASGSTSPGRGRPGLVGGGGPAEHGPHPGHQLPEPVGLGHVVVGPDLEADHGVDLRALGRDHDDRHRRPGPDRPADVDARQPGQHQVEQDQVGLVGGEEPQRLVAVAGHGHVEALAGQADDQRVDERLVVLGQQHLGLCDSGRRARPTLARSRTASRRVLRRTGEDQGEGRSLALAGSRPRHGPGGCWPRGGRWRGRGRCRPVSRLRPWSTR